MKKFEARKVKVHGEKGVYSGGEWLPIEQCADLKKNSCGGDCDTCPRSKSKNSAMKEDGSYDVVIIGAGCIGTAIARELSKFECSVLLLEAADDVSQGATKGNSGIVHAGFDDKPGTVRSKFCWKGNQMFPQLDKELNFGYQKNGSLVLAKSKADMDHLEELKARGITNGVQRLEILNKEQVFALEPYVHPDTIGALYSPDAGNLIPYEFAIALAENAVDNGVELRIRREVKAIEIDESGNFIVKARHWEPSTYKPKSKSSESSITPLGIVGGVLIVASLVLQLAVNFVPGLNIDTNLSLVHLAVLPLGIALVAVGYILKTKPGNTKTIDFPKLVSKASPPVGEGGEKVSLEAMKIGGSGSSAVMNGQTIEMESIKTKYVVNCAGSYSDKIAEMIGDKSFKIKPRLGDYLLLHKDQGFLATHTLFPCPGPLGKGVLVQATLWGNLILGPTARDMHIPEIAAQSAEEIQSFILSKCAELVPSFDPKQIIHAFAGARAKSDRNDWIIEPSVKNPRFIHAAGIDSPGLAGSPAIALEVVRLLGVAGLPFKNNPKFNPYRAPIIVPKNGYNGLKIGTTEKLAKSDPQNIICKCEKVTEGEIVDALHRSLPVDSTQAVRRRTRAGMGHCQGDAENYNCECRVAAIIARETGVSVEEVSRRPWPATSTLPSRWKKADA